MTAFEIAQLEIMNAGRVDELIQVLLAQEVLVFQFVSLQAYLIFGYLVAAYFVGENLTRPQLIALNGLYIFCSMTLSISILQGWIAAVYLQDRLLLLKDSPPADPTLTVGAGWSLFIGVTLCWMACLFFMWSIRNSRKNEGSLLQTTTVKSKLESFLRP